MGKLDGRCLCGNVTYSCDADPVMTAICHCTDCQRQTGSAFSVVVVVPGDSFEVRGDTLASYSTVGDDSGKPAERRFCGNCGSPIVTDAEAMPGLAIIKAGTLDDRSWLEPQMEVWCESAQPWVPVVEERQRMERSPSM